MHKEPIEPNKEIIKRGKKKSKTVKKSNHKHNYVYYKEYVGNGDGTAFTRREGLFHIMMNSDFIVHHMCSICGKDSQKGWLFILEDDFKEAIKNGIDITHNNVI